MSSDVMPTIQLLLPPVVAPEPPPSTSVMKISTSRMLQKALEKNTRALYDSGADDNTTNDPFIIFNLRLLSKDKWTTLYDAGKTPHFSKYGGESYLRLKNGQLKTVAMRLTPSMKITAIDPSKLKIQSKVCVTEAHIVSHQDQSYYHLCQYDDGVIEKIPLQKYSHKTPSIERYYSYPFLRVTEATALLYISAGTIQNFSDASSLQHPQIQARSRLNAETTRILWHARLGHIHDGAISLLSTLADGVPKITPKTTIDKCQTCMETKLTKIHKSRDSFRQVDAIRADKDVKFFQHLQIDIGIIVQRSKNEERVKRLSAYNGDTCYVAITCIKTNYVLGATVSTKEPAVKWLQFLLVRYCPWEKKDKTFRMDCGGETGYSSALAKLLEDYSYKLDTIGPDNSSAIGKVERFNRTVKGGIRSLIVSVSWSWKVWNYAFYHYIRIYNSTPHGNAGIPYTNVTGKRVDHSRTRIFGCPVMVLKNGSRPALDNHSRHGRFAGYNGTMKKILYFPKGKTTPLENSHVQFDELFSSYKTEPPIVQELRRAMGRDTTLDSDARRDTGISDNFDIISESEQFAKIRCINITPSGTSPLGIILETDLRTNRGYISDVLPKSLLSSTKNWRTELIGSFVTRVNDELVFTKQEISDAIESALSSDKAFHMTVSTDILETPMTEKKQKAIPQIQLDQLRFIASNLLSFETREDENIARICSSTAQIPDSFDFANISELEIGEDTIKDMDISLSLDDDHDGLLYDDIVKDPDLENHSCAQVNAAKATKDFTSKSSQFTRSALKKLDEWEEWKDAEWKQLDSMVTDNMFGSPISRSDLNRDTQYDIMRVVWSYLVKLHTQKKKARVCGDGRPLRPAKKCLQKTYAACASMTGIRLMLAIAAYENRIVMATDAVNTYAQSGPLEKRTYLVVDDAIREWYYQRYKLFLPPGSLIELKSSIQGHPDAGANWQEKVNLVLSSMNWISMKHEPCLYRKDMGDAPDQLMCRQVDDMLLAVKTEEEYHDFNKTISKEIRMEAENKLATSYNGLEIEQTEGYIAIRIEKYINKVAANHGWENDVFSKKPKAPLSDLMAKDIIESGKGPLAKTPEAKELESQMGFPYRMLLGELIFAFVVVRLDIGYAMSLLSRYAEYPAKVHYLGLKSVTRYLRETKRRPIIYWRKKPMPNLPRGDFVPIMRPSTISYSFPDDPYLVTADVDASHATDKESRRSTGGHIIMVFAAAVLWLAKLQATLATSSTESEFMQAVSAAKGLKWTRHIMNELKRTQTGPSPINEDNMAAIMMVNQSRPTTRTRHIDIQWFAIQEWKQAGDIVMQYINTSDNSADAMTKALGWVLHNKHAFRSMGHYGSPYSYGDYKLETNNE